MSRWGKLTVLALLGLATAGCCLFRDYDGKPPGFVALPPSKHPVAIANRILLGLISDPFVDESQTHRLQISRESSWHKAVRSVRPVLLRKLANERHIKLVNESNLVLRVKVETEKKARAIFALERDGKVIWRYEEELTVKGNGA